MLTYFIIPKIIFIDITTKLLKESLRSIGSSQAHGDMFSTILIYLKARMLSLVKKKKKEEATNPVLFSLN